jgi:hypothetical protein
MTKVLRGYAKGQDGNPILNGTIPVPHSKDKRSPRERLDKRHLIRQGPSMQNCAGARLRGLMHGPAMRP